MANLRPQFFGPNRRKVAKQSDEHERAIATITQVATLGECYPSCLAMFYTKLFMYVGAGLGDRGSTIYLPSLAESCTMRSQRGDLEKCLICTDPRCANSMPNSSASVGAGFAPEAYTMATHISGDELIAMLFDNWLPQT
jgi:hypothetical protein